jgi:hypothetical protein
MDKSIEGQNKSGTFRCSKLIVENGSLGIISRIKMAYQEIITGNIARFLAYKKA